QGSAAVRRTRISSMPPSATTCGWPGPALATTSWRLPLRGPGCCPGSNPCPAAGTPRSGRTEPPCPAANGRGAPPPRAPPAPPNPAPRAARPPDRPAPAGGGATLLITHELAGLDQVDEVIVLDHGKVAERGTHEQLMRAGGAYRQLHDAPSFWPAQAEPVS